MISFLGHVCPIADLSVSAIHSWALKAGMRIDTRGLMTGIPLSRPLSEGDARRDADVPGPGALGDELARRPLPELPRGVSLGMQVVQHLLILEGVHTEPEAIVGMGHEVSFLHEPLEWLVEELLSVANVLKDLLPE